MNKALRQFLVLFILICAIALVVLFAQVFLFGERAEPEAGLPEIIGDSPPAAEDTSSQTPGEYDYFNPPEDESPPVDQPPDEPGDGDTASESPPPEGMERAVLPLPGIGNLIIDYAPDVFGHDEQDYGDSFLYISPDAGSASMSVLIRTDMRASDAPHFFDDAEPSETIPGGARSVGRTGLTGQHVTARMEGVTFEAWLVDIDGGVVAVTINYGDEYQKDALYQLIDSMRLAQ